MNSKCEALDELVELFCKIAVEESNRIEPDTAEEPPPEEKVKIAATLKRFLAEIGTPVPTPRAQMVTDAMMDAAWIAFNKFSAKVVLLRYRMRAAIEAALSTPVVPDETDMGRARTAETVETGALICGLCEADRTKEPCRRAHDIMACPMVGHVGPLGPVETAVRSSPEESHKGYKA